MDENDLRNMDSESTFSDEFMKKLLLNAPNSMPQQGDNASNPDQTHGGVPYVVIKPEPGMCMKTRTDGGDKVFINICHSDHVPEPQDLSDDELIKVLESEDPSQFRIPMSIGEPHAEIDKGGSGCTAYDVIIHPKFMTKIKNNELFRTFFLTIMCEGVETKYDILLKRDWVFLKNRRCIGRLVEQHIRKKSKPLIMDMGHEGGPGDQLASQQPPKRNLIEEVHQHEEELKSKAPEPNFTIVQEPCTGHPQFLVAEIHLPNIKTAASLTLDIGEDRMVLTTRSHVYHLDIFLPFNLINEECGSQFDRISKVLTVTMPVQPLS